MLCDQDTQIFLEMCFVEQQSDKYNSFFFLLTSQQTLDIQDIRH